jgi:hypothetical protein
MGDNRKMDKPVTRKGRPKAATKRSPARPKTRKKAAATRPRVAKKATTTTRKKPAPRINLDDPALYLNRELTWLESPAGTRQVPRYRQCQS